MPAQTARCPVCGRDARVTLAGRLYKHKARLQTYRRFGAWCDNTSPTGRSTDADPT